MAVATFDTLKFANTLKAAGVPDKQAEAQAAAFAELVQVNFKELATKEDLDRVAKATKEDLDRVAKAAKEDLDRVAKAAKEDLDRVAKAAKGDLDQATADLKRDIAELRTDLKHEIQAMQTKHQADLLLVKWMFGATFTGVVAVLGMLARLLLTQVR